MRTISIAHWVAQHQNPAPVQYTPPVNNRTFTYIVCVKFKFEFKFALIVSRRRYRPLYDVLKTSVVKTKINGST